MDFIDNYYNNYDEEGRLGKDLCHKLELITTMKYLQTYINQNNTILDIGAGTGRYSIYCAENKLKVTALEFNPHNISIFQNKIKKKKFLHPIHIIQGDGRDLSQFKDSSFDFVLNMGPLYHLRSEVDKMKTLEESFRVLKSDGIAFLAYVNTYAVFFNQFMLNPDNVDIQKQNNLLEKGCATDDDRDLFFLSKPKDMEDRVSKFEINIEKHLCADGIAHLIPSIVNNLDQSKFDEWVTFHLKTCEESSLLGSSIHNLLVCKKR